MILNVFGQIKPFGDEVPQFAHDEYIAGCIADYAEDLETPIERVQVLLRSACTSQDVVAHCSDLGYKDDEHNPAEWLSWNPLARIALQNAGFDGFAALAPFENIMTFQVVAFNEEAVTRV